MACPARLSETPAWEEIKKELRGLCTNALRTYWILEKGRGLLGLDCVRAHLTDRPKEERDYAVALRAYLEDAVKRVESPQNRVILEVVLGVGSPKWRAKNGSKKRPKSVARKLDSYLDRTKVPLLPAPSANIMSPVLSAS